MGVRSYEEVNRSIYSPAKHSRNPICAVIRLQAQGLLTGRIPHTHHEDKARVDDSLDQAEEEAVYSDASEVVARGCRHEQTAPYCVSRLDKVHFLERA